MPTPAIPLRRSQLRVGPDFSARAPELAKIGRVEGGDIDVGAAGFEQAARPLRPDSGHDPLELLALDDPAFDSRGKLGQIVAGDVEVSPHSKQSVVAKIGGRAVEERARRGAELGDDRAAIAFEPESGGPPCRMNSALAFRLDQQDRAIRRDLGAEAGPADSTADDQDVIFVHSGRWLRF